ncbi:septation ring formation regulator EzrA [Mycobacterium sp. UM_CSW]|uniref:septation ring formation regulator EzrA n=1 Tax=Mycobacterium sp. UM_CSW TaxID=1370119 RepID=UPI0003FAD0AF|nr:septation ring formation regulator EzrA [Mycobacterium sp. UM_CSW]
MPKKGRGRRPVWCSARCRRQASAERIAARNAGAAARVVEVPRAHRPDPNARLPLPSMHTLQRLFLSSDYQCQTLLEDLARRYTSGAMGEQLRAAVQRFVAAIALEQALADDPVYRRAREDVERLRERLCREVERAERRDRELARLRRDAEELWRLRARVAELESALAGVAHPLHQAGQHDQVPVSRQQRRAAQRAARKTC